MTPEQALWFGDSFEKLANNIERAILGKPAVVRLALTCLFAEGHLLLEDVPGTGKTMLAKSLANAVQGTHNRIQFTPDLLPSDVTGTTILNQRTHEFEFHHGPVFATILLADEINRASPKTQSALLEVMEEGRVTHDGVSYPVGPPFMVVATQNPIEQAGTYRLPEAQLDRFLMKTSIGYPDRAATVQLLSEAATRNRSTTGPTDDRRGDGDRDGRRWWLVFMSTRRSSTSWRRSRRPRAGPPRPGSASRLVDAWAMCEQRRRGRRRPAETTSCPMTSSSSPRRC